MPCVPPPPSSSGPFAPGPRRGTVCPSRSPHPARPCPGSRPGSPRWRRSRCLRGGWRGHNVKLSAARQRAASWRGPSTAPLTPPTPAHPQPRPLPRTGADVILQHVLLVLQAAVVVEVEVGRPLVRLAVKVAAALLAPHRRLGGVLRAARGGGRLGGDLAQRCGAGCVWGAQDEGGAGGRAAEHEHPAACLPNLRHIEGGTPLEALAASCTLPCTARRSYSGLPCRYPEADGAAQPRLGPQAQARKPQRLAAAAARLDAPQRSEKSCLEHPGLCSAPQRPGAARFFPSCALESLTTVVARIRSHLVLVRSRFTRERGRWSLHAAQH